MQIVSTRTGALAGLVIATTIALTGCASANAATPTEPAARTVMIDNARPTLIEVETTTGGQTTTALQEDREVPRDSVEVPYQPEAIVTFDLATLDTLDALGVGDAVVGIPDVVLPDYLAEYGDLPKVGTLFEPDFEAVVELDPDLIVTAARSTGQYDALSEITTTIDLTATSGGQFNPEGALVRAGQLGELFGVAGAVADVESRVAERVAEIQALTADAGPALFIQVSGGDYGAYGEGSRFGYFFDVLGFTPAVTAAELPGAEGSSHGDTVSNEFLLKVDPAWILVLDRNAAIGEAGAGSAAEVLDNELVRQTQAAKDGHIVQLPSSELYIVVSGLTAIERVLDATLEALQG